jgi:hypothetical protein
MKAKSIKQSNGLFNGAVSVDPNPIRRLKGRDKLYWRQTYGSAKSLEDVIKLASSRTRRANLGRAMSPDQLHKFWSDRL